MTSCFHHCRNGDGDSRHLLFNERRQRSDADGDVKKNQELDVMLSQAFNQLTFEEREEQQDLLHGVDDEIAEETDFVNKSLQELDEHLMRIKSGSVYEQAEMMDPIYVRSRALRVTFLRGNRYDTKAAADQMIRFFKMKQKIFGTEKLVKDITIDDLDEDDRACLSTGCIQVAYKDRSNRPIIFQVQGLRAYKTIQNELRVRYLVIMKVLENEEAQKRGGISLNYIVGQYRDTFNGEGISDHHNLVQALPLFPAALHICTSEWAQAALANIVVRLMPTEQRARFRLHFGTHIECLYMLSTYGIPSCLLPFKPETSTIDLVPHLQWCHKNFGIGETKSSLFPKQSSSNGSIITEPDPNDVLSSGFVKSDNVGNDRLRVLVKEAVEGYRTGSADEKRQIVDHIIGEIHREGGRFLHQESGSSTWSEISLSKVRLKISQRIRNHYRRRESVTQQAREGTLIAGRPLPNDVVFGKVQKTKGGDLLHHLVKLQSEDYEALDRRMKVVLVDSIMERIKSEGGRFLQPTPDLEGYVELSTDFIRERISTIFRNNRRVRRKKKS